MVLAFIRKIDESLPMQDQHQLKAEAAISNAKAILAADEKTVVEMDRIATDGNNQYTVNVGAVFSARTEVEHLLKAAYSETPFGDPSADWLEAEAAKLGFEL
jgi:hypothetical protein